MDIVEQLTFEDTKFQGLYMDFYSFILEKYNTV